jgi:hypothetical protein
VQRKTHPFVTSCMSCTSQLRRIVVLAMVFDMFHSTSEPNPNPEAGFWVQKKNPKLGTHSGTNSWCQNEVRFLGFVLDPPGQLKIRSRVIKNTFRHSDSQTFRNSDTQTLRRSDTQTLRHSDTQTFRHSDIQTRGRTHNRPIARTGI